MNSAEFLIEPESRERDLRWRHSFNLMLVFAAGFLLLAFAYWSIQRSEVALNSNLESKLFTIVDIETEAIDEWVQSQMRMINYIAADPEFGELVARFQCGREDQSRTKVAAQLRGVSRTLNTRDCILLSMDGHVLADSGEGWLEDQLPLLSKRFSNSLQSGKTTFSKAFEPRFRNSELVANDRHLVLVVAAPIMHPTDGPVGSLGVVFDFSDELSRILGSSRTGATGETVAIDAQGQPVSACRQIPGQPKFSGFSLEPKDFGSSSMLGLVAKLDSQKDVAHRPVVVAGRWLDRYSIGIVTKMDRIEAFAPIAKIRFFLWTLGGFLALTTFSTFFYRWYLLRSQISTREAELRTKRLGPYSLEKKIGEGGMGIVYQGRHALLRRQTAIKILPPEKSSQEAIAKFEREVRSTSQLNHPNTISIYDYGRTKAGLFYYAMELLQGVDLEQLIARDGPLSDGRAIQILIQVGLSLREAHQLGLVHRDIKPANIMICDRGGAVDMVKVLDFGMVREQKMEDDGRNSDLSGTPIYMAPESFEQQGASDARVDVFALGAVGYFLLTGKPLIEATSLGQLLRMHRRDLRRHAVDQLRIQSLDQENGISEDVIQLIGDCVASVPSLRIASIEEVVDRLRSCLVMSPWTKSEALHWWREFTPPKGSSSPSTTRYDEGRSLAETKAFSIDKAVRRRSVSIID